MINTYLMMHVIVLALIFVIKNMNKKSNCNNKKSNEYEK